MHLKVSSSPNIAFIKYWGKKYISDRDEDRNLSLNPSLSMTLSKAQTQVEIQSLEPLSKSEFLIEGCAPSANDEIKLWAHVHRIEECFKKKLSPFRLSSANNFPMGTGIASSASAYSALTCALIAWARGKDFVEQMMRLEDQRLSSIARQGSGSACRSLQGPFVEWNDRITSRIESSWKLYDTILIFSKKEKKVSSSEGHKFATLSRLFPERLGKLPTRLRAVREAINKQSLHELGQLIEEESTEMHTIMRENPHPIEYQLPETKTFLSALTKTPNRNFYFTLDAGPNVHLISEQPIRKEVQTLLAELNLAPEIWEDQTGYGPKIEGK